MERRVGATTRREALVSRRAARESATISSYNNGNTSSPFRSPPSLPETTRTISIHKSISTEDTWRRSKRAPIQNSLLASLSRALTNIDAHNNSHDEATDSANNNSNYDASEVKNLINNNEDKGYRKVTLNPPQYFSSYLNFTRAMIQLLTGFTCCYLLVFVCCLPMLSTTQTAQIGQSTMGDSELKRGESFYNIRGRKAFIKVKEELGTMKQRAIAWEEAAKESAFEKMEDVLESSTVGRRDGADALKADRLLEEAVEMFDRESGEADVREQRNGHDHWEEALKTWEKEPVIGVVTDGQQLERPTAVVENDGKMKQEIYQSLHGNQKPGEQHVWLSSYFGFL